VFVAPQKEQLPVESPSSLSNSKRLSSSPAEEREKILQFPEILCCLVQLTKQNYQEVHE